MKGEKNELGCDTRGATPRREKGEKQRRRTKRERPCAAILITGYLITSSAGKGYFPSRTSLLGPYILMMM